MERLEWDLATSGLEYNLTMASAGNFKKCKTEVFRTVLEH